MNYSELVKYFISISTITAAVIWLVKTIITELITRDNYKFSKLHEEQCLAIKKMYSDFHLIYRQYYELYSNAVIKKHESYPEFRDKHVLEFVKQVEDTKSYFDSNKILINKVLADKISKMFDIIYKGLKHSTLAVIHNSKEGSVDEKDFVKHIDLAEDIYLKDIPKLLNILEVEFRKIYGVK